PAALEQERGRAAEAIVREREPLALAVECPASPALERLAARGQSLEQFAQVRDDEPPGHARGRGPEVRCKVAERRVLLVPDRRDDRHRARGDGAHEPLVAERQQILEAATAAG